MKLRNTWLRSASARRRVSASASVRGAPRSSARLRRMPRGTSASTSAERWAKPSSASIFDWSASSGPMWRRSNAPWSSSWASAACGNLGVWVSGMAASWLFGRDLLVGGGVQQLVEVRGARGLDAEHPRGEGILVHLLRRGREVGVGGDDLAGDRGVDVARGLHRLDDADRLALGDLAAGLRRLDEHHVAQLLLRVIGDADAHGAVRFAAHPLVAFGVAEVLRQFHGVALFLR